MQACHVLRGLPRLIGHDVGRADWLSPPISFHVADGWASRPYRLVSPCLLEKPVQRLFPRREHGHAEQALSKGFAGPIFAGQARVAKSCEES